MPVEGIKYEVAGNEVVFLGSVSDKEERRWSGGVVFIMRRNCGFRKHKGGAK